MSLSFQMYDNALDGDQVALCFNEANDDRRVKARVGGSIGTDGKFLVHFEVRFLSEKNRRFFF